MKRLLLILCTFMLVATTARAQTVDFGEGAAYKIKRGFVNMFTGIIEVPMQIGKGYNDGFGPIENEVGSKTVGTVLGLFRGFSHAGGRMSWGALELFGFWAANPEDNMGVGTPFDAEYAWEEGVKYDIFDPSFEEAWIKPVGRKLGRGLGNGFLGIAELPGQTIKGAREGNVVKGLGKGFWFWMSRGVYGMGDIMSALVPNPEDNPGYPFDEKWPWDALAAETE